MIHEERKIKQMKHHKTVENYYTGYIIYNILIFHLSYSHHIPAHPTFILIVFTQKLNDLLIQVNSLLIFGVFM